MGLCKDLGVNYTNVVTAENMEATLMKVEEVSIDTHLIVTRSSQAALALARAGGASSSMAILPLLP